MLWLSPETLYCNLLPQRCAILQRKSIQGFLGFFVTTPFVNMHWGTERTLSTQDTLSLLQNSDHNSTVLTFTLWALCDSWEKIVSIAFRKKNFQVSVYFYQSSGNRRSDSHYSWSTALSLTIASSHFLSSEAGEKCHNVFKHIAKNDLSI